MVRARKNPPDGRSNNGGPRQGTPGQSYPQRSDMRAQKIQTVPNQEYGKAAAQAAAQRTVPIAAAPPVPTAAPGTPASAGGVAAPQWATPEDTPSLTDPTRRPSEPVTAGLPFGPGPGPDPRAAPMSDTEARLRALYAAYPTRELRELIDQIDMQ